MSRKRRITVENIFEIFTIFLISITIIILLFYYVPILFRYMKYNKQQKSELLEKEIQYINDIENEELYREIEELCKSVDFPPPPKEVYTDAEFRKNFVRELKTYKKIYNKSIKDRLLKYSYYSIAYDPYPFDEDHIESYTKFKRMIYEIFGINDEKITKKSWNKSKFKDSSSSYRINLDPLTEGLYGKSYEEQKDILRERLNLPK